MTPEETPQSPQDPQTAASKDDTSTPEQTNPVETPEAAPESSPESSPESAPESQVAEHQTPESQAPEPQALASTPEEADTPHEQAMQEEAGREEPDYAEAQSPDARLAQVSEAEEAETPAQTSPGSGEAITLRTHAAQVDQTQAADVHEAAMEAEANASAPEYSAAQSPDAHLAGDDDADTDWTTPGADMATPDVEEEDHTEDDAQLAQAQTRSALLHNVLETPLDDFSALLETISLNELVLLMEGLAEEDIDRDTIRKVGAIKRSFDQLYSTQLEQHKEADLNIEDTAAVAEREAIIGASKRFSTALGAFNKRRASYEEALEEEKKANSKRKKELLTELRELVMAEEVQGIKKVRAIQDAWKEVGPVLGEDVENFYRSYKALLDQYYTMRSQYLELLEQDRKINLEKKQALIGELQALTPEEEKLEAIKPDEWKTRLEGVKELHKKWKAIGPVPREQREIIWEIFKTATDHFYDQRRAFFNIRDKEREVNAAQKRELLAKLEAYTAFSSSDINDWRQATDEIKAIQQQWRGIGEVPFKQINELNKTYRKTLDTFFDKRSEYFSELDKEAEKFNAKKQELLDRALEVKDNEDMVATAETLKRLQREWKKTGPNHHRDARKLQKKFRKVCDVFFKKHKAWIDQQEQDEHTNKLAKEAALEKLDGFLQQGDLADKQAEFEAVLDEYLKVGQAPPRDRAKLDDVFWQKVERFYEQTEPEREAREQALSELRLKLIKQRPQNIDRLIREQKKLERRVQEANEKIGQYENNILFISRGKSGEPLRKEIQGRIDQEDEQRQVLQRKLKQLKRSIREIREAEKAAKTEKATPTGQPAENEKPAPDGAPAS